MTVREFDQAAKTAQRIIGNKNPKRRIVQITNDTNTVLGDVLGHWCGDGPLGRRPVYKGSCHTKLDMNAFRYKHWKYLPCNCGEVLWQLRK